MIIDGFDVEATESVPFEIVPGVAYVGASYDPTIITPPAGYPDGRVKVWTVPSGVAAVTFVVRGAGGGVPGTGTPDPAITPTTPFYAEQWPVSPGDEFIMAAGAPPVAGAVGVPNRGAGPVWGGYGSGTDSYDLFGFAGGGASVLWLNGVMVTLSAGGGGCTLDLIGGGPPDYDPLVNGPDPSTFSAGSAGSISRGGDGSTMPTGGGGGGAAGGAAGASAMEAGQNGAYVSCPTDGGGPASPTWTELGIDPESTGSLVQVFFYIPRAGGWSLDEIRF